MSKTPARPATGSPVDDKHMKKLYRALDEAGLGGLKIASIKLAPPDRDDDGGQQNCHAEQTPDGHWNIVCD